MATVMVIFISLPGAYALSRWRSITSRMFFVGFLMLRTVPLISLALPYFLFWGRLELLDTRIALVLTYIPVGLPLAIWFLKGFFDLIPISLEEAAVIDGASMQTILFKIIAPLALQGIGVASGFVFLTYYIEYILALTITDLRAATFPIYLTGFVDDVWIYVEGVLAASMVAMVPMIILYSVMQRYMRKGVMLGTFK